jgi:ATP-dependent helicase/nuclease subunit B
MADRDVAMLIDGAGSQEGKQRSDLISVGKTGILELAQLDLLQNHTLTLLAASSEAILHGVVDIKPYKMNDQKACTYCKYSSFCQFDELLTDNVYNQMHKLAPDLIWQRLALAERGESSE